MKNNHFIKALLIFITFGCYNSYETFSQMVVDDIFLLGMHTEVGTAANGSYGSWENAPTGYHPRPGTGLTTGRLGFVADPDMDGWAVGTPNYFGDYFLPGSPQEGWNIEATSANESRAWRGLGTGFTNLGTYILTGSNTSYSISGAKKIATWEGTFGPLSVVQRTELDTTRLFFVTYVTITNTGTTTVDSIYYNRSVDPDNEQTLPGGSFVTRNNVVYQPGVVPGAGNKCLVTARGSTSGSILGNGSYLGLGTVDCRAKAYIVNSGLYPYQAPHQIFVGALNSYYIDVGDSLDNDVGIGVAFNLGSLAAGDSTKLAYAYILSAAQLDSAFATLAPTFGTSVGSYSNHDTLYGCAGDSVDISIVGGDGYNWTAWTPTTGLTDTVGASTTVVITEDTITYSAIGETIICDEVDTFSITIIPFVVPDPGEDSNTTICSNADPINLYTVLAGTPEVGGVWTGPGVTAGGLFSPVGFADGFYNFTYTTFNGSCTDSAKVTLQIFNDVDIDFDFEIYKGCDQDSVVFTNNSDSIVYFRWNFGDGSPYDSVNFSTSHVYSVQDEYPVYLVAQNTRGCIDSLLQLVNTSHPLDAVFTQSADSICQSNLNTVTFNDVSVGNITAWYWDFGDGDTSNLQNPNHTFTTSGTHTIMLVVTDDVPCNDTFYSTVYVDPTPFINIDLDRDSICLGEQINVNASYETSAHSMMWDFGDGSSYTGFDNNQSHNYTTTGTHFVTVTTTHDICPQVSDVDTVLVKPYPQINLGADTQLCLQGAPITVDADALVSNPANTIYYWSTGDTASSIIIKSPGTYIAHANLEGCITTDDIIVNKDCYADIPNSFTPNGDGDNDYFFPRQLLSEGVVDFNMTIYNRWGEIIFETNNPDGRGWDGKLNNKDQPVGVYVYQITVRYKNLAAEKYTGNVTLLR